MYLSVGGSTQYPKLSKDKGTVIPIEYGKPIHISTEVSSDSQLKTADLKCCTESTQNMLIKRETWVQVLRVPENYQMLKVHRQVG